MFQRWRTFEPWERRLLLRLFVLLPAVWIGLRLFSFDRIRRLAEVGLPSSPTKAENTSLDFAQRCAELTLIAGCHGLYKANCLHQSLALCRILRLKGLPARLRIGVLPQVQPFQAHAWVELGGVPLGKQSVAEYQAFDRLDVDPNKARFG